MDKEKKENDKFATLYAPFFGQGEKSLKTIDIHLHLIGKAAFGVYFGLFEYFSLYNYLGEHFKNSYNE